MRYIYENTKLPEISSLRVAVRARHKLQNRKTIDCEHYVTICSECQYTTLRISVKRTWNSLITYEVILNGHETDFQTKLRHRLWLAKSVLGHRDYFRK